MEADMKRAELVGVLENARPAVDAMKDGRPQDYFLSPEGVIALWNALDASLKPPFEGVGHIADERVRQVEEEGWTPEHDWKFHWEGDLVKAAVAYAMAPIIIYTASLATATKHIAFFSVWPWGEKWWKPTSRFRNLVKAGALIAAELDRVIALPGGPHAQ